MATTVEPQPDKAPDPPPPRKRRHPALDFRFKDESTKDLPIDKFVFGVTAAIAVGFLLWGFLSTASLPSASEHALGWTMQGWTGSSSSSPPASWSSRSGSPLGKFGNIPLGRDDEEPEFRTSRGSR